MKKFILFIIITVTACNVPAEAPVVNADTVSTPIDTVAVVADSVK